MSNLFIAIDSALMAHDSSGLLTRAFEALIKRSLVSGKLAEQVDQNQNMNKLWVEQDQKLAAALARCIDEYAAAEVTL